MTTRLNLIKGCSRVQFTTTETGVEVCLEVEQKPEGPAVTMHDGDWGHVYLTPGDAAEVAELLLEFQGAAKKAIEAGEFEEEEEEEDDDDE